MKLPKFLIQLRKMVWLPIKWKLQYKEKCLELSYRKPHEILELQKKLKEQLVKSKMHNDAETTLLTTEKLKLIKWITNV